MMVERFFFFYLFHYLFIKFWVGDTIFRGCIDFEIPVSTQIDVAQWTAKIDLDVRREYSQHMSYMHSYAWSYVETVFIKKEKKTKSCETPASFKGINEWRDTFFILCKIWPGIEDN